MLSYEKALELKNAGFPKETIGYTTCDKCNLPNPPIINHGYPTLSELIEACGDEFEKLSHMTTGEEKWLAKGSNISKRKNIRCFGPSPEEAVANLWLELHDTKS